MLRVAGYVLITCPSVALAQLVLTGTVPSALLLLGVALVAGGVGALTGATTPPAAGLAVRLAVAQIAGHALVYLALGQPANGCLPAMGRGAVAGLRLAILSPDAACEPGQYAAGPVLTTTAGVLLAGALVLLWQLAAAAAGSLLLSLAAQAWAAATALAALAAMVVLSLRRPFEPYLIRSGAALALAVSPAGMRRRVVSGALLRRGPPALAA